MELLWTPFDIRFSEILKRFENHKKLFDTSIHEVFTEETLRLYNKVDLNMEQNAARQFEMDAIITRGETEKLGESLRIK
jgi:hypothetical protein